jgi:hypothetical protein
MNDFYMSIVYFIRKAPMDKILLEERKFRSMFQGELPFSIDVKGGEKNISMQTRGVLVIGKTGGA